MNQIKCGAQIINDSDVTFHLLGVFIAKSSFTFLTSPLPLSAALGCRPAAIQVFKCLPRNGVHNMRELKEYTNLDRLCDTDPEQAKEELKAVRGLLVHYPLKFLCEENLLPPLATKEGMAPVGLWT